MERPEPLAQMLGGFVERCRREDHLESSGFPSTDVALTKTSTRVPVDARLAPPSRRRRLVEDELLATGCMR